MITNAFKRIIAREAMDAIGTKIRGVTVSFKSNTRSGVSGHVNTDLISEEELEAIFGLCKSIAEYDDFKNAI